jgi:hypothetical protein
MTSHSEQFFKAFPRTIYGGDTITDKQMAFVQEMGRVNWLRDIILALCVLKFESEELKHAQAAPMDDEYVGRVWLAMEKKAQAEAKLWEAYDA